MTMASFKYRRYRSKTNSKDLANKTWKKWRKPMVFILVALAFLLPFLQVAFHKKTSKQMKSNFEHRPVDQIKITTKEKQIDEAKLSMQKIKENFYERYGGEVDALKMLNRAIVSPGSELQENKQSRDIESIAKRIIHAIDTKKDFVMAFGGYSVTVGRGNYFHQSYPFIVKDILQPLWKILGIELVVRNAAIGGIPSFPYGWCMANFLGVGADVISWDFSMNEGSDTGLFESYLRHSIMMNKVSSNDGGSDGLSPMVIMYDEKNVRTNMLYEYVKSGYLADPIALRRGEQIVDKTFLNMNENDKPSGYKNWDEWGGPKGSPGQQRWHPKYMEHAMYGWVIAMHMLRGYEYAIEMLEKQINWKQMEEGQPTRTGLPKPINKFPSSLFLGIPQSDRNNWTMNNISCRTNFKPLLKGSLNEIIVSGVSPSADDPEKVMVERSDKDYENGWLIDVGPLEKKTKKELAAHGGLGYIDMKIALYGKSDSGELRLFLPYESSFDAESKTVVNSDNQNDHTKISSIVLCEVNEKRGDKECDIEKDLSITVGGIETEVKKIAEIAYLKKNICIDIEIPLNAKMSTRENDTGLEVGIVVNNPKINHRDGACSIAHVIWENASANI